MWTVWDLVGLGLCFCVFVCICICICICVCVCVCVCFCVCVCDRICSVFIRGGKSLERAMDSVGSCGTMGPYGGMLLLLLLG